MSRTMNSTCGTSDNVLCYITIRIPNSCCAIQGLHLSDGTLVKESTKDQLLWLLWKMQLDQRGKFSEVDLRLAQKNTFQLLITIHNILILRRPKSHNIGMSCRQSENKWTFYMHSGTNSNSVSHVGANLEIVVLYVRPNSPKAIEMRTLRLTHKISEYGGQIHKVNQICYFLRVVRHGLLQSLWQHFHYIHHRPLCSKSENHSKQTSTAAAKTGHITHAQSPPFDLINLTSPQVVLLTVQGLQHCFSQD
ncbi:2'-hydroxybiphenyl-2-sulfinate desulfinase [Striga asiatica]|uniref:2'-hydroxybiphenyl-2-sulfinate desulfinase n=1 Tax=Striga asiatica TaxID=4170 RepID=A0A5A7PNM9_STRAF|nr:2'-hydroxybiphenyl-2-sulfinate desulfinase [Striga asiatica]